MSTLCMREKYTPLSKQIDGAVITSSRDENMNCTLTFQTELVSQRFMLRFDDLRLDCYDHLYVYDGDGFAGQSKVNLSCRSTRGDYGLIFFHSNYVTLKYQTDQWSQSGDGFTLVITAVRDTPDCRSFKCHNTYCISYDLICDGVDHCGDNSDETNPTFCLADEEETGSILGLPITVFIGLVITVFLMCLSCVLGLAIYLCKREQQMHQQHQRMTLHQATTPILAHPASYNGTMGSTLSPPSQRFATLPLEKMREKPPPYPGNMYAPSLMNNATSNNHIIGNSTTPVQQVVYYSTK